MGTLIKYIPLHNN